MGRISVSCTKKPDDVIFWTKHKSGSVPPLWRGVSPGEEKRTVRMIEAQKADGKWINCRVLSCNVVEPSRLFPWR